MIACDTSTLSALLSQTQGSDIDLAANALSQRLLWLPPATYAEALSNPRTSDQAEALLDGLKMLPIQEGFWLRVAKTRRTLLRRGLKARLADALIAQSCIDADVPLITRDRDFRHFAAHCGLKLAAPL